MLLSLHVFGFCVQVFLAIDRSSHSASDTLYGVFPYITACFLLLCWVASKLRDYGDRRVAGWALIQIGVAREQW